ncbi:MAG TPA: FAD-dependent oxidoreductase [Candidatus Dormibacteraeota bacterium]
MRGRGRLPDSAPVVIVGGGITGVALLRHLPRAILIEQRRLAWGASGRNAGFLLAGVASCYADAVAQYGRDRAAEIWAFTIENRRRLLETGVPAGIRGSWTLAASDAEADALFTSETMLEEDGFGARWDPARRGLLIPEDGECDPAAVVSALATGHEDRIVEGVGVTAIEPGRVEAGGQEIATETIVLATNAFTGRLADVPIAPVRGQMLATAPTLRRALDRPTYADRGYQYWRQLDSGEVLAGGYRDRAAEEEIGYSLEPSQAIQAHLDAHVAALGVAAPVTHRWAGTMGFTPDGLPLVGELPGLPGVFVCGGYTGHGLGFAFECARRLAEHLSGGQPPPAWLSPVESSRR